MDHFVEREDSQRTVSGEDGDVDVQSSDCQSDGIQSGPYRENEKETEHDRSIQSTAGDAAISCKCSDFTAEIERFFMHDGVSTKYEEFELSDLGAIDSTDPNAVAQKFITLSKGDQIKAFFGGLAEAMCGGARTYFEQVEAWEKQYNFLERLV